MNPSEGVSDLSRRDVNFPVGRLHLTLLTVGIPARSGRWGVLWIPFGFAPADLVPVGSVEDSPPVGDNKYLVDSPDPDPIEIHFSPGHFIEMPQFAMHQVLTCPEVGEILFQGLNMV